MSKREYCCNKFKQDALLGECLQLMGGGNSNQIMDTSYSIRAAVLGDDVGGVK